jgi:aspartate racemase
MKYLVGEKKYTVGIIGGMGPEATIDFMSRVIALTPSQRDQDHIHMVVENNPHIPDRQATAENDLIALELTAIAERLEVAGADFLVLPCNTAHVFIDDLLKNIQIPFVHIVNETVNEIVKEHTNVKNIGLLATDMCINSGIYHQAIKSVDRTTLVLEQQDQKSCMQLIYDVKKGKYSKSAKTDMVRLADQLIQKGADIIVAGCTEIPLILDTKSTNVPLVSSTEVLAKRTVEIAIGIKKLKSQ